MQVLEHKFEDQKASKYQELNYDLEFVYEYVWTKTFFAHLNNLIKTYDNPHAFRQNYF